MTGKDLGPPMGCWSRKAVESIQLLSWWCTIQNPEGVLSIPQAVCKHVGERCRRCKVSVCHNIHPPSPSHWSLLTLLISSSISGRGDHTILESISNVHNICVREGCLYGKGGRSVWHLPDKSKHWMRGQRLFESKVNKVGLPSQSPHDWTRGTL